MFFEDQRLEHEVPVIKIPQITLQFEMNSSIVIIKLFGEICFKVSIYFSVQIMSTKDIIVVQ